MGLFQYQQKAEPVTVPAAVPPLPDLSWLPAYPARLRLPARRAATSPAFFYTSIIILLPIRVSQLVTEQAMQYSSAALLTRVSQLPAEVAHAYAVNIRRTRVSQLAVEIARPFGCQVYVPPPPPACPIEFVVDSAPASRDCPDDLPVD